MGSACIVNANNRGITLAEYLKTQGKIESYIDRGYIVCFEFKGELEISFEDYLQILPNPSIVRGSKGREHLERESFNKWVLLEVMRTLRGGEVIEYIPGEKIKVIDREKTEVVCVRVTPEVREKLEKESQELGVSISALLRAKLLDLYPDMVKHNE